MKRLPLLFLTLVLANSCFQGATSSSKKPNSGTSDNAVESTFESPQSNQDNNVGPTGITDPVAEEEVVTDTGITYYDDPDPEEESVLPGTPANICGHVYRQFNNPQIFFNDGNTLFNLQKFSYDSEPFLAQINFTNDSFNVCIDGYVDGSNFYVNTAGAKTAVGHPLKSYKNSYIHEYCGLMAYITNAAGNTTLNIKIGASDYLVHNKGGLNLAHIPTTSSSITSANSIEACLYTDKASYKNFAQTFKPQIEAYAIDKGALN